MDSIYWVVSRDCNQSCSHCYINSRPGAPGLNAEQVSRCVEHLPKPADVPVNRVFVTGGEPLAWPYLLFHTLSELYAHFGANTSLFIMTNGDLLDEAMLQHLIDHHVFWIDVAGMDRYHNETTLARRDYLERLFEAFGVKEASAMGDPTARAYYKIWGVTEDCWVAPLWPRGRALANGLATTDATWRFCPMWGGAKNFLNYRGSGSEVNIQLADVYPCCPMTARPLGSLLEEPLTALLDRHAGHPVFETLNRGCPEALGEHMGISEEEGRRRSKKLGSPCLWCDEFFTRHAPELLYQHSTTARGATDLEVARQRRPAP